MLQEVALSPLDQFASRGYISLLFCFPSLDHTHENLVTQLQHGLSCFASLFPVVKGHVQQKLERGHVKVVYSVDAADPPFAVRDTSLKYEELRQKGFPIQGPRHGSVSHEAAGWDGTVVAVKVSKLRGGLILCFSAHHSFVNAAGLGVLTKLYAECCSGKIRHDYARVMKQDRVRSLQGTDLEDALIHHGRLWMPPEPNHSRIPTPEPISPKFAKISIAMTISEVALQQLKHSCAENATDKHSTSFISALDAATSLLFVGIMRARSPYLPPGSICSLNIAVDGRSKLVPPLPDDFLGNSHAGAIVSIPVSDLNSQDVGVTIGNVAFQIRTAITAVDNQLIRSSTSECYSVLPPHGV
ncbi:uncharacterized protein BDZ99DRAFT_554145 [Mytilinidion resinicola]|uniref:Trichothecene 3-O-acetyltransferase n=1 Tax=Mytilinidion resinicola TaxID=574789 RepID=A0A6A6Z144_9PEZI|nr:uncharacterized protein BDZ99DRAFT_554145 [Mytilinidion resinicola]KAF2813994.1 hypothetical protein BDZ99DRAFT_554145 [Mytilinidion resinicola]